MHDPVSAIPTGGRPLRVLFMAHSPHRGGAEYCLDTTFEHLDRSRIEPAVVFPDEGPMTEAARRRGLDVIIIPLCYWLYFRRDWWYWKNLGFRSLPNVTRLVRLIRRRRIDLVYTNTAMIFEPALAARIAGVPHLWHVHEILETGNAMDQALPLDTIKGLIYRLSDRIVFESNASRRVFEKTSPGAKSAVIHNSLRLPDDSPGVGDLEGRACFGLAPSDEVVGFVGQFIDRKNPLLLLQAIELLRHRPHLKCLFVGEGPLREQLHSTTSRMGLEDRCKIVGFQPDVRPMMRALDVLVLPSRQESFGLVLLEAAAFGKPVIACESEGPSEVIVHGKTGLLVPQEEPVALAGAISRMFDGSIDRPSMGDAGQSHVAEHFDAASNTRRLEGLFSDLLAGRSTSRPPAEKFLSPASGR